MTAVSAELALAQDMGGFFHDPLGFVRYTFPWRADDLADHPGPDAWQADILETLGRGTLTASEALRVAVASGHGIGKTALVSWIILWMMSTRPHLAGVITANTGAQLADKTWRELALWHKRAVNRHWFRWTATRFYQADNPETWFVSAVPWRKERPEAFAGLHAEHVLMLFDEASAVDDVVWETAEGAMTTPGAVWVALGNPTRNTGRFFECFHRFRHRWITRQVDSRTARMANKDQLRQWVDDYGEESDFVRIRVRGMFPRAGGSQLIEPEGVAAARGRLVTPKDYRHAPKYLGVDVARFGEDQSVCIHRQGLLAHGIRKFRGKDTMAMADIVRHEICSVWPDDVFIDQGGIGAGVVDRLHRMQRESGDKAFRRVRIHGVDFGGRADEPEKYCNKRAEMWGRMRDWFKADPLPGIPDDNELVSDITAPEYGFSGDKGQIVLEKKADMKKRGLPSPDCGDALALTFAGGSKRRRLSINPNFFGGTHV